MKLLGLRATVCAVGVVLLVGLMPAAAGASQKKTYKVILEQGDGQKGFGDQTIKAVLYNTSPSQTLGALRLVAPDQHAIESAKVGNRTFTPPAEDPQTVTMTDLALPASSNVAIELQVEAPHNSCGTFPWGSDARQANEFNGNPGNKFTLDEMGSKLTTVVTGCDIAWGNQPADARINEDIRAVTLLDQGHFDPNGPALKVVSKATTDALIEVSLHKLVGDGQLSGTTDGKASAVDPALFNDLQVDHGGTYQLIASDGQQEARSEPFLIEDGAVDCSQNTCIITVTRTSGPSGLGILSATTTVTMTVTSTYDELTTLDPYLVAALIPRNDIDIFGDPFVSDGTGCQDYEEKSPFYGRFDGVAGKTVTIKVDGESGLSGCYFDPVPFIPSTDKPAIVLGDTDGDKVPESFGAIAPDCTVELIGSANPCVSDSEGDTITMKIPKRQVDPGSVP